MEGGDVRYGLPYKGSKNQIAEWVVANLPKAEIFVDLFFGGGAVTHAAMLSGKWERFIINDIDGRLSKLFIECAYGKHTVEAHPEWISREEFFRRKDEDAYVALVWSFGNNGKDYLYGVDIEEMKHAYHKAIYEGDLDALKRWGYVLSRSDKKDVYGRYMDYQRQVKAQSPTAFFDIVKIEMMQHLISMQSLESIQRLQSLQSLQRLQSLQSLHVDYRDVKIPPHALVYCDPPYKGTNCGKYDGFDHEAFYEWARGQDNIFISEYSMPDDFVVVASIEKVQLSAANGNDYHVTEYLFTNQRTYNKMTSQQREMVWLNSAVQLTLFEEAKT